MKKIDLLMHFMRSLKTKGLLDEDIHGSVVDVFINSELPRLVKSVDLADVVGQSEQLTYNCNRCGEEQACEGTCGICEMELRENL